MDSKGKSIRAHGKWSSSTSLPLYSLWNSCVLVWCLNAALLWRWRSTWRWNLTCSAHPGRQMAMSWNEQRNESHGGHKDGESSKARQNLSDYAPRWGWSRLRGSWPCQISVACPPLPDPFSVCTPERESHSLPPRGRWIQSLIQNLWNEHEAGFKKSQTLFEISFEIKLYRGTWMLFALKLLMRNT